MTYYNKQLENLRITENEENFIKIQITSIGGKTNWLSITEAQLNEIFKTLNNPKD